MKEILRYAQDDNLNLEIIFKLSNIEYEIESITKINS